MIRSSSLACVLTGSALINVISCSQEPIDPEQLSQDTASNAADVLHAAALSVRGTNGAERTLTQLNDDLGRMSRALEPVPLQPPDSETKGAIRPAQTVRRRSALGRAIGRVPAMRSVMRPLMTESLLGPTDGPVFAASGDSELAADFDDTADTVGQVIRERILVASNLEEQSDSQAIYLLRPDPTCRDLVTDELDESCRETLTRIPLRVRLTREGAGSRLELLVGAARTRPLALSINPTLIAVNAYLADMKVALEMAGDTLNDKYATPGVMKGTVRIAMRKDGLRKVTLDTSILEMLDIEETGATQADTFVVRSGVADPAFAIFADGDRGEIGGSLDIATTEIITAWQPNGSPIPGVQQRFHLAGLNGAATIEEGSDEINLTRVGVGSGPSYWEVRGRRIFQLDLNEHDGRAFDARISFGSGGVPRIAAKPTFALVMAWNLGLVASDYQHPPEGHLLDETYRITLSPVGAEWPAVEALHATTMGAGDAIRIASGKLTISSSRVATPVTAEAGQCLMARTPEPGQHAVLDAVAVGSCP